MTATDYLSRTLGRLRQVWSRHPQEFLGHSLADPRSIAETIREGGTDHEQVKQFLNLSIGHPQVSKVDMIIALRTLMEGGSNLAANCRNTGYAMAMGDIHDQAGDYLLATIEYGIAYLHNQDSGLYHVASEIETRNRPRDAQGYMDAVYWLVNMPEDPAETINSIPEEEIVGHYPEKYYEELAKALRDHPEIRQVMNADILVYRGASAAHHGLERSRAWGLHMDGLRSNPTDHALANPYIRRAFDNTILERDYET